MSLILSFFMALRTKEVKLRGAEGDGISWETDAVSKIQN